MDFLTAIAVGLSFGQLEKDCQIIIDDPEATEAIRERAKLMKEGLEALEEAIEG